MAGCEHEAQQVVADVIVERGVEIRHSQLLLGLQFATKLRVLALEPFVSAERVDGTVLRGGHEPSARVVRDARFRPLLECGDESVLRELLGKTDIAHDPSETGDDLGRLNPPDRIDGAMCIDSRHSFPSHHLRFARASLGARHSMFADILTRENSYLCFGSEVFRARRSGEFRSRLPSPASVSCEVP